ncbi:ABC transporter ATP-binding protein [Geomonas sp. Red32]|uniref:ABC transporter ATP-binding protein n=1 Tax=Geomonas sp. Red32 TaxID=2912856 RepID=UPI00202CE6DB|nr:ABC transporter ATP-binding protein [Geomonas sp. Red32]MCM0083258.1 ABC transporter ATP-binding protein [Geomonas sp. Red32]
MTTGATLLEISGLKVDRGGVQVLDVAGFSLRENEFVSLIGPNGAGKSTLLLTLMGLLKAGEGSISYRGRHVGAGRDWLDVRRKMSMVLQEPLLFDTTVYDNVASGLKIRGLSRTETAGRVAKWLERFGLAGMAGRSARRLSGGEARRVSLARAFATEPEIIFFDEPFSNLDAPTRQALTEDMDRILRDASMAAVLVTHDQSEALRMSTRIVVMNGGEIIQSGSPAAVMNAPVNEFVANFVGMETILEGEVVANVAQQVTAAVAGVEIDAVGPYQPGEAIYCCIRPENVTIALRTPSGPTSARNLFPAKVIEISSLGPFLKVRLDCGFPLTSYVTRESFTTLELYVDKEVFASFKATSVHLISQRRN